MKTLVMTIGTGRPDAIEETLFAPLTKSFDTGDWSQVVLLPSQKTTPAADEFRHRILESKPALPVQIEPLPPGDEEDADRAYAHFDNVLRALRADYSPADIVVDFTRGTKVMSAAIVLAASRHAIHELRYVTGDRDDRGTVRPGIEVVRTIHADTVDRHRRTDLAREMLHHGNFKAAEDILDGLCSMSVSGGSSDNRLPAVPDRHDEQTAGPEQEEARRVARYYAAWDRLDYESAAQILKAQPLGPPPDGWRKLWPTDEMLAWTASLAKIDGDPPPSQWLCRLIADLIANGERRIALGQHEDALVRAYRVLELIGQTRLFEHGLDSAKLDHDHWAVKILKKKIEKKKQDPLSKKVGRFQVARLLNILEKAQGAMETAKKNDLADSLLAYDRNRSVKWKKLLHPKARNRSLLIHGFRAKAGADPDLLSDAFRRLEAIAHRGWPDRFAQDLEVARTIHFQAR